MEIFEPVCPVCRRVSLMGIHPSCILSSTDILKLALDHNPRHVTARKHPCKTCPFMRTTPNWMLSGFVFLNRLRLKKGIVQDCHSSHRNFCQGQLESFKGNPDALGISDLTKSSYNPAKTIQEARDRFNNAPITKEVSEEERRGSQEELSHGEEGSRCPSQ